MYVVQEEFDSLSGLYRLFMYFIFWEFRQFFRFSTLPSRCRHILLAVQTDLHFLNSIKEYKLKSLIIKLFWSPWDQQRAKPI